MIDNEELRKKIIDSYDRQLKNIFTEDEIDDLASWLTAPNYPTLFHMYDYEPDVYKKYDYFAVCQDI